MSWKDWILKRGDIKTSDTQGSRVSEPQNFYPESSATTNRSRASLLFTLSSFLLCAFSVIFVILDYLKDPSAIRKSVAEYIEVSHGWNTGRASILTLSFATCFFVFDFLVWKITQTYWYLRRGAQATTFLLVTIQKTEKTFHWVRLAYVVFCMAQFAFLLPSVILGAIDRNILVVLSSTIAYVIARALIEWIRFKHFGSHFQHVRQKEVKDGSGPNENDHDVSAGPETV